MKLIGVAGDAIMHVNLTSGANSFAAHVATEDFSVPLLWMHNFEYGRTIGGRTVFVSVIVCLHEAVGSLDGELLKLVRFHQIVQIF